MSDSPVRLPEAALAFVRERHLATFTSLRADGSPHVTPVGFTWDEDAGIARIITSGTSAKARNAARGGAVALCQVEGRRWLALEGVSRVSSEAADVADAERRYAERYRIPRENPKRVVIEITVTRTYGSSDLRD
jgi:PPOX class probable F420-dependent enzyme